MEQITAFPVYYEDSQLHDVSLDFFAISKFIFDSNRVKSR